ncbi:MAG: hypothetical protein K8F91_20415, partial [Candidatus Obscuribacterales bacterium]|nr:hypothetical protein [Candidatus Obscuribacterales bacterium]
HIYSVHLSCKMHLCCKKKMHLSCKVTSPSWRVDTSDEGLPTVHPSVRQIQGCLSHFWLKEGEIDWCLDSGSPSNWTH